MTAAGRGIGAHVSIAGTLETAIDQTLDLGCDCLQIFTRSPRAWKAAALDPEQVARFRERRRELGLGPLVVHGSYLINLAAAEAANRERSIEAFRDEVERAGTIGADYLVIHPGSAKDHADRGAAVEALAEAFAESVAGVRWAGLEVLLENTAGGGASLGREFAELAAIRRAIRRFKRAPIGYCIDTAHSLAAGYDVSTEEGLETTLREIDGRLGLDAVKVIHANDSKAPLGSRVDRHEHIGQGHIGAAAFGRILNHPALRDKAFILETPLGEDGTHRANADKLRELARTSSR